MFPSVVQSVTAQLYQSGTSYSARTRVLVDACDITLPPAGRETHCAIKDFYIDQGNCQGQASSSAQSDIFFDTFA